MTTPVRVETVLGDESSTEVMRLLNVELSEEV